MNAPGWLAKVTGVVAAMRPFLFVSQPNHH